MYLIFVFNSFCLIVIWDVKIIHLLHIPLPFDAFYYGPYCSTRKPVCLFLIHSLLSVFPGVCITCEIATSNFKCSFTLLIFWETLNGFIEQKTIILQEWLFLYRVRMKSSDFKVVIWRYMLCHAIWVFLLLVKNFLFFLWCQIFTLSLK